MTTIASPRPSSPPSTRRDSVSTINTVTSTAAKGPTTAAERAAARRNRIALRDYYNLKTSAAPESVNELYETPTSEGSDVDQHAEFDALDFNADAYVTDLLAREGLEDIIRVEASLVGEIRNLDGEKKALVYDNYSKLIAATDTIKSMREKMDPMTPTTNTLTPAIAHIVQTAVTLSATLKQAHGNSKVNSFAEHGKRDSQRELVQWALAAPERLRAKMESGHVDEAKKEWAEVSACLLKWQDIEGVSELQRSCLEALRSESG